MATSYRAINESRGLSDRDLKLLKAVADKKRKEGEGDTQGGKHDTARGK